jgi:hypothetical protein
VDLSCQRINRESIESLLVVGAVLIFPPFA